MSLLQRDQQLESHPLLLLQGQERPGAHLQRQKLQVWGLDEFRPLDASLAQIVPAQGSFLEDHKIRLKISAVTPFSTISGFELVTYRTRHFPINHVSHSECLGGKFEQRAQVAQCCNLSHETLLFGWIKSTGCWFGLLQTTKRRQPQGLILFYNSATTSGHWTCRKNIARNIARWKKVERKGVSSIPREDIAFSVFNPAIMIVYNMWFSVLVAILIIIVK